MTKKVNNSPNRICEFILGETEDSKLRELGHFLLFCQNKWSFFSGFFFVSGEKRVFSSHPETKKIRDYWNLVKMKAIEIHGSLEEALGFTKMSQKSEYGGVF